MLDTALAEETDLGLVGAGTAGGEQVLAHFFRRVLEAAGLLDRRAAAEVDLSRGQGGGAAAAAGALEEEHLRSRRVRLDGRTRSGSAEADDDDVRLAVPARHVRRTTHRGGFAHVALWPHWFMLHRGGSKVEELKGRSKDAMKSGGRRPRTKEAAWSQCSCGLVP